MQDWIILTDLCRQYDVASAKTSSIWAPISLIGSGSAVRRHIDLNLLAVPALLPSAQR
jgi:hypothetical protein